MFNVGEHINDATYIYYCYTLITLAEGNHKYCTILFNIIKKMQYQWKNK